MSRRTVLHINSKDRYYGTTSDFRCRFPPINDVVAFSINSVEMCNTFFNIRGENNSLIINVDGKDQTAIVVTPGNYTRLELGTAIKEGSSGNITAVSENQNTNTLTFTTGGTAMKLVYAGSTMAEILGITQDSDYAATTTSGAVNLC